MYLHSHPQECQGGTNTPDAHFNISVSQAQYAFAISLLPNVPMIARAYDDR